MGCGPGVGLECGEGGGSPVDRRCGCCSASLARFLLLSCCFDGDAWVLMLRLPGGDGGLMSRGWCGGRRRGRGGV